MTLTNEQLREWRASLDKVTLGPWHYTDLGFVTGQKSSIIIAETARNDDAAHLARCDPQTIGTLIDEVISFQNLVGYGPYHLRNAALDEAAQASDAVGAEITPDEGLSSLDTSLAISARIRALKTPEQEDG